MGVIGRNDSIKFRLPSPHFTPIFKPHGGMAMRKFHLMMFSAPLLLIFASQTHATLLGDEVMANWTFEDFSQSHTFTVIDGIELNGSWGLAEGILDVQDSTIVVDMVLSSGFSAGVMWDFLDLDWVKSPGKIIDVSVSTNYVGWSDTFVSFGPDSISVNFQREVSFDVDSDIFNIAITTKHVPEPSVLALLVSGLVGMGFARKRIKA